MSKPDTVTVYVSWESLCALLIWETARGKRDIGHEWLRCNSKKEMRQTIDNRLREYGQAGAKGRLAAL